jgi:ABC-type multidrug transport system fused ATPase/permease subunit
VVIIEIWSISNKVNINTYRYSYMGIGFVIIMHLIAISILSGLIAIISTTILNFVSKKETRNRYVRLAKIYPFIGIYTFYICGLIGSGIVSINKNIDIGIGDLWYVPLQNNYQLAFIDIPERAYIDKNGETIISEVSQLQQIGNKLFVKTQNNKYFSYNTQTGELKEFFEENDLKILNNNKKTKLISAINFYTERRNNIEGNALIYVGIISFLISIVAMFFLGKRLSNIEVKRIPDYQIKKNLKPL